MCKLLTINYNIFLIGLMGSGKSTIGKLLAKKLGRLFYDSDIELETMFNMRIPMIFSCKGENIFRQNEIKIINKLSSLNNIILATGGGVILHKKNRLYLTERGITIYLYANPYELYIRNKNNYQFRPLLFVEDQYDQLVKLFNQRDQLYRQCANFIVNSGQLSIDEVINIILIYLNLKN